MNRLLIRLGLVATLLCGLLGSSVTGVRAQGVTGKDEQKDEAQIKQNNGYLKSVAEEPQSLLEVVFRSAPSSYRVVSNPGQSSSSHGGKPGKHHGRWVADAVYKPFNCAILQLCRCLDRLRAVASPPRLYYVIALRRLLC